MINPLNPLDMKLGLVRIQNEKLVGVQYFESKFQRELGEVVSINNVKWTVAVIGEDRDTIVDVLNGFIKKQNSNYKLILVFHNNPLLIRGSKKINERKNL